MSRRSRRMRGITLALVAGGVIVWRCFAPAGRMEVQLVFIAYTNTPFVAPSWHSPGHSTLYLSEALLCATNTGSVPVKLWSAIQLPNMTNTTQFAQPTGRGLPAVLKRGESVTVSVRYPMTGRAWQTEFMYQRHDLVDRIFDKAWGTGNRTVQTWTQHLLPTTEFNWVQSGWINPPPAWLRNSAEFSRSTVWIRKTEPIVVPDKIAPAAWDGSMGLPSATALRSDFIVPSATPSRY